MTRARVDVWFDFASTYSYPAAMRIGREAASRGVEVRWRPFLLGPIFAAQGWTTSPFNLVPAKGRHMWRDLARETASLGLPFVRPAPFPQNSLLAARVGIVGEDEGWIADYARAVFAAEFGAGRPIAAREDLGPILAALGLDAARILDAAVSDAVKSRLRDRTDEARRLDIFGAPSFVAGDGELFWGNDRLEQAVAWAAGGAPS